MGRDDRSVAAGPTTASRASATSRIWRAIGPRVDSSGHPGGSRPPRGTRPRAGLRAHSPLPADGMRIDPPPSDPVASGTSPAARAAADPPDNPPAERSSAHGLRVGPNSSLTVSGFQPSSGVLVLPTTTHPAARSRSTRGESAVAGGPAAEGTGPRGG